MKKLLILFVLAFSAALYSQTRDEIATIQSLYGQSKGDIIKQAMHLAEPQSGTFDKIYADYETERAALGIKKLHIIENYALNYSQLTDQKADELAKDALKNNLDFEKLYAKTYNKAKKAIGAKEAAKFIQLEVYFQTVIRGELQDAIPFIDELDKTRKI
jgi:methanogenic corrinoid protein MtbC1